MLDIYFFGLLVGDHAGLMEFLNDFFLFFTLRDKCIESHKTCHKSAVES